MATPVGPNKPFSVSVEGVNELSQVFKLLPPLLAKKYMRQLVTWGAGQARKRARVSAPVGPPKGAGHRPIKRNIKSRPVKKGRQGLAYFGKVSSNLKNAGARHANPLLAGHKTRDGGGQGYVQPYKPNFFELSMRETEPQFQREGMAQVEKFIARDVKRLGEQQTKETLSKAGAKRLAALKRTGLVRQFGGQGGRGVPADVRI